MTYVTKQCQGYCLVCAKILLNISSPNNKLSEEVQGFSSLCDQTPLQNLQLATELPITYINVPVVKYAIKVCGLSCFSHVEA